MLLVNYFLVGSPDGPGLVFSLRPLFTKHLLLVWIQARCHLGQWRAESAAIGLLQVVNHAVHAELNVIEPILYVVGV